MRPMILSAMLWKGYKHLEEQEEAFTSHVSSFWLVSFLVVGYFCCLPSIQI